MDIDLVTATIEKYGLADRFDAKKVLLKMGGRRPGKHCIGKAGGKGSYIAAEKQCAGHKTAFGELTEAGKASARELADKVRARKGMAAIEKAPPLVHRSLKMYERNFKRLHQHNEELKGEHANRDRITNNLAKRVSASGTKALAKSNIEIAKIERSIESSKRGVRQTDIGGKQVRVIGAGKDPDGSTTASFSMAGEKRGSIVQATVRFHEGEVEHLPPATINGKIFNVDKAVSDHIKAHAEESKDFADFVSRAVASHNSPVDPNLIEEIRTVPTLFNGVPYVSESALQRAAEVRAATSKTRRKNSTDRRDSQLERIDTMDIDFITATLDKYGLADRFDAKKVLLKMGGRRPGKHCVGKAGGKGSYIAAEKQCAGHKGADGKLTAVGKQSARELAARVRDRKGMQDKRGVTLARMSLEKFMEPIKGAATEKQLAPGFRKMHKEERSELNKRRINSGRAAIVDKNTAAPHEMTMHEWAQANRSGKIADIESRRLSQGNGARGIEKGSTDLYDEHKKIVQKALRDGKPVPKEVLAEHQIKTSSESWRNGKGTFALSLDKSISAWDNDKILESKGKLTPEIIAGMIKEKGKKEVDITFKARTDRDVRAYMKRTQAIADLSGYSVSPPVQRSEQGHSFEGQYVATMHAKRSATITPLPSTKPQITPAQLNAGDRKQAVAYNQQGAERAKSEGRSGDASAWDVAAKSARISDVRSAKRQKSTSQGEMFGIEETTDLPLFRQRKDSQWRFDRAIAGGKAIPKSSRKKHNCTTRSHQCGSVCIPLTNQCRDGSVSSAQTRLKKLKQSGANDFQVQRAKNSIKERTAGKRAEINDKRIGSLRNRVKNATLAGAGKSEGLAELDPHSIEVDPKRFQYKIIGEHTTTGSVGSLSGVRKYDPNLAGILQVWKDPKDGKTYVVNGHNRLDLGKKLGADSVAVRYLKAPDAKTARSIGALTNIAEGRGDALDAAKFFRDTGISKEDLSAKGIPMREKIATDGLALSKLDDSLFRKTIDGDIPMARAAIIGGSGLEPAQQRDLMTLVDKEGKKKNLTDGAISEMVDIAKSSRTHQESTMSLFGEESVTKSNMIEKAKLQAAIKQRLSREKNLFGTVSRGRAATELARGGNTIDREKSGDLSTQASQSLKTFDQMKNLSGPMSDAINHAASRMANGESQKSVEKDLYAKITSIDVFGKTKKRAA